MSLAEVSRADSLTRLGSYTNRGSIADNSDITPSLVRPTFVIATIRCALNAGETGRCDVYVDGVVVADPQFALAALGIDVTVASSVDFVVPAGKAYKIDQVSVAGTPTFTVTARELTL